MALDPANLCAPYKRVRLHMIVCGAVQGVGFRPFVYRLATEVGLSGWVNNSPQGVQIEVEGNEHDAEEFLLRIKQEKPLRSFIQNLEVKHHAPVGSHKFEIRESNMRGAKTAPALPDIAVCDNCLQEVFDPENRRYLYPFTNCTDCGPRFSIIEALPYDRPNTSMKIFAMCEQCQAEYENPYDRRFHAQPNACPACGPHLELWNSTGAILSAHCSALSETTQALCSGAIVAIKGIGGFHLLADARREETVRRLRRLKHREEKPFAVMFPSLAGVKTECEVDTLEESLLCAPEAPIVLLRRRFANSAIASSVAPRNSNLGVLLPYTPLHHILMQSLGFPVLATSGNLADEPICIDEREALERLGQITDLLLVHNRPIVRHVDDSIVRVMGEREMMLRCARGYAPLSIPLKKSRPVTLAIGAHLKNSIALSVGDRAFVSQHIGDLENAPAFAAFHRTISDFESFYEVQPKIFAVDAHPNYISAKYTRESGKSVQIVQHHYAHVLSCMAENEIDAPVLGIAWDGTGFGTDGTIWGGEFLKISDCGFDRVAHMRPFRLPGGEMAIREPRRTAIGLLYEIFGDAVFQMDTLIPVHDFTREELAVLSKMLPRNLNSPTTTSMGRLFDAISAISGLIQKNRFEGQAAMELEFALTGFATNDAYEIPLVGEVPFIADWQPLIEAVTADANAKRPAGKISVKFHNALVEMLVAVAHRIGERRVVLTGGCFQNKYLTERAIRRLREEGFHPFWHRRIPPNDGGIALGQIMAAHFLEK